MSSRPGRSLPTPQPRVPSPSRSSNTATTTFHPGPRLRLPARGPVALAFVGVAAAAWAAHALLGSHGVGHHGALDRPGPVAFTGTLGGWVLMSTAMMLPAALPLVAMLQRLVDGDALRMQFTVAMAAIVAFIAPWALVGLAAVVFDAGLHGLAHRFGIDTHTTDIPLGVALLVAGTVQFSPLTRRCLDACRSPEGFLLQSWRGAHHVQDSLRVGWGYGLSCVGCCWALMLVCFALGATSAVVMVSATVVMAAERLVRQARPVASVIGAAALVGGLLVLFP